MSDHLITLAGDRAVLIFQMRELLAAIEGGDLDDIRAQAELARRSLEEVDGACK